MTVVHKSLSSLVLGVAEQVAPNHVRTMRRGNIRMTNDVFWSFCGALAVAARAEDTTSPAESILAPLVLDGPVVPLKVGDRVVGYVLESEARWLALDVGTSPSMSYSVGGSIGPGAPRK